MRQHQIVAEGDSDPEYSRQDDQQNRQAKGELNRRLASLVAGAKAGADTFTQGANSHMHSW
jgi:hypothetical protein